MPRTEQPKPNAPEAEQSVLGAILLAPSLALAVDIEDDAFHIPANRVVWDALRGMAKVGAAIDVLTLEAEIERAGNLAKLPERGLYLQELAASVATAANVEHYAEILREKLRLRRLIALGAELQVAAASQHESAGVVSDFRAQLAAIEASRAGGPVRVGDVMHDALEEIESKGAAPDKYVVQSGLPELDELITGFRPGQMIIVAARPGVGKTALLGNIAVRAARRKIPVLIFTLEMSRQEMIERFLAFESRVSAEAIGSGSIDYAQWKAINEAGERLSELPLWVDDRVLNASQIDSTTRQWHARNVKPAREAQPDGTEKERPGLCLFGLDYLGLVRSAEKSENREREVAGYSRGFKLLCKELKAPGILVSQLNRKCVDEKRKPQISDLRESGTLEQDANMIIFPWREPMVDADGKEQPGGSGPAELIIPKNRGGRTGFVSCHWLAEIMSFESAAESWREE